MALRERMGGTVEISATLYIDVSDTVSSHSVDEVSIFFVGLNKNYSHILQFAPLIAANITKNAMKQPHFESK